MPKHLTDEQIETFRRDGAIFPIPVFEPADTAARYERLQALENERAGRLPPLLNFKPHLLIPWLWELIREPRLLDPVEDILGPDLLCWEASFFVKAPSEQAFVPWHQDSTYWGLTENEGVTAWLAFTPSVRENGCMRIIPGTHRSQVPHVEAHDRSSMLPLGEKVAIPVAEGAAIDVVLAPGEMSIHHPVIIHGSEHNTSDMRRVGFVIRYIPARLSQRGTERGTATLVRGRDHGTFDLEQAPEAELDPAARARHSVLLRRWMKIVSGEAKAPI
ncbi:MAG: phytanoyl-CoA dioxygenase family protein [Rhizomicrobium sp.]